MEIADSISCDFYESNSWKGREESKFHIYKEDSQVGLEIETIYMGDDQKTEEITRIEVSRMELKTVKLMQSRLGDWLQEDRGETVKLTTSPVEGTYEDSSGEQDVRHLEVKVTSRGFRVLALSSGGKPVENAARIPSTDRVNGDEVRESNHLERLYSLFEIFLAGVEEEKQDVIRTTKYLLNPEAHLHSTIPSVCVERLENEDYTGVIQAAGTALEEILKQETPEDLVREAQNTSDLANRAFRESDPVFRWGYTDGEQKGLMFLYSGVFKALRNPVSHPRGNPDRNRFLDDIDERDAIDILCLFNFLARRLDKYGITELEREGTF
ncbi:TIGR02391 family protein [Halorhabdus salina]|uniref:TIGR02391 family protein n=1 Tax=Halorhabdus salina TaxID=2750670 RepID=UPI0015EE5489|nr:TIGR02391 family protein [Halorhabdus salina]